MILEAKKLVKVYGGKYGTSSVKALNGVSFTVNKGEFVGIMGASGSGKSTLLKIIGGMDLATSGLVILDNEKISSLRKSKLALIRRRKLGFVFQDYNLLDSLTVLENIMLPLIIDKVGSNLVESKAKKLAYTFGINSIINKYPFQISGGQKQKTAIARAVINNPAIILADEPTGNLDSKSSNIVMGCFRELIDKYNDTILMVSHDPFATSYCDRVIFLSDGKILFEIVKEGNNDSFFEKILNCQEILKKQVESRDINYEI